MVEMLNEIAMKWHDKISKYNPMTDGTPYPFASGPIDNGYKLPINPPISKMEITQTAVDFYIDKINEFFEDAALHCGLNKYGEIYEQAKQMEKEQRIKNYNAGYTDAQCNHINDAENYANEQDYLNDKKCL